MVSDQIWRTDRSDFDQFLVSMSDLPNDMQAYLQMAPEAYREAMRGLATRIAQTLAQADALGCGPVAMYLAAARDAAEAAAERDGPLKRTD